MDFDVKEWVLLGFSFISGICVTLWRVFTVVERVSLVEKDVKHLQTLTKTNKEELDRLEDRLLVKLESIDEKLDKFIIENLKNGHSK